MKGLVDHIHALGLKAGIYSGPGPTTCGGCLASYQHEAQDVQSYCDWGFDYLKYDWCSYGDHRQPGSRRAFRRHEHRACHHQRCECHRNQRQPWSASWPWSRRPAANP